MFELEVKPYPKRIISKLASKRGEKETPTLKIHSGFPTSNESQHDLPIKIADVLNKERHKMKKKRGGETPPPVSDEVITLLQIQITFKFSNRRRAVQIS